MPTRNGRFGIFADFWNSFCSIYPDMQVDLHQRSEFHGRDWCAKTSSDEVTYTSKNNVHQRSVKYALHL